MKFNLDCNLERCVSFRNSLSDKGCSLFDASIYFCPDCSEFYYNTIKKAVDAFDKIFIPAHNRYDYIKCLVSKNISKLSCEKRDKIINWNYNRFNKLYYRVVDKYYDDIGYMGKRAYYWCFG